MTHVRHDSCIYEYNMTRTYETMKEQHKIFFAGQGHDSFL